MMVLKAQNNHLTQIGGKMKYEVTLKLPIEVEYKAEAKQIAELIAQVTKTFVPKNCKTVYAQVLDQNGNKIKFG